MLMILSLVWPGDCLVQGEAKPPWKAEVAHIRF